MRYADAACQYEETFEGTRHYYVYSGKCVVTGKTVSVKVPGEQLFAYRQGAYIQDAFPDMSVSDREFLMSGISQEGWDQTFSGAEE